MKKRVWSVAGAVVCLAIAVAAYLWATGLMDSQYAYRSPLRSDPPRAGAAPGEPLSRRLVFVLVDGLRLDTALDPQAMPFLAELRQQGAWAAMHSRAPSYSAPAYSVLLTGAWPDLSDGPAMNLDYEDLWTWTQDNLVSAAHRAGRTTALSAYNWFEKMVPQESVSAGYYTAGDDEAADRAVMDAALPWLKAGEPEFVLVHLDQLDWSGHHEGGARDERWTSAAGRVDGLLREIAAELDLGQDTLFVCSDHGHLDKGGHGGPETAVLSEPFLLAGAAVRPGDYGMVQQVDVAPTLAVLLGANIPASAQGRVLTDMLQLTPDQEDAVQEATLVQQYRLLTTYQSAIGRQSAVEPGPDPVASHQQALAKARAARLRGEIWPRAVAAIAVLVILAIVVLWKRSRELLWLLVGGVVYNAVFHVLYRVVRGQSYSLSSVTGAGPLIVGTALSTAAALALAWLVVAAGLRLFRGTRPHAFVSVVAMTLVSIGLALLPALVFWVAYGPLVAWALPDQRLLFIGILAVLQVMVLAVVGLLLAGLSALIVRARKPVEPQGAV